MTLTEMWVTEMMLEPVIQHQARGARHTSTAKLPESVKVQLANETAEVGRLKVDPATRGSILRAGQEVRLEQVLVDDEALSAGVPADGSAPRVVG